MTDHTGAGMKAEARMLLSDVFDCHPDEVPPDAGLGVPAVWDSIGHMRLVLAIEAKLGRMLSPEEIVGIACLNDVERLLAAAEPFPAG